MVSTNLVHQLLICMITKHQGIRTKDIYTNNKVFGIKSLIKLMHVLKNGSVSTSATILNLVRLGIGLGHYAQSEKSALANSVLLLSKRF